MASRGFGERRPARTSQFSNGDAMRFELKKTLIGVAALSLLLPVASHAQTSKGQWLVDGFNRSPRDGQGSTCVSAGGLDYAFDAAHCTVAATEAQTSREAVVAAKRSANEEAKAAYAARRAAEADKLLEVEPGSGLKPGQRGAYTYDSANGDIRDGFGRNCIKDGRWGMPLATESCEPELYNKWRAKQQKAPETELARRLRYTAEEAERSVARPSVADEDLAKRISQPPPEKIRAAADDLDRTPGVVPAAAPVVEVAPLVDNTLPDFPVTTYAGGGGTALVPVPVPLAGGHKAMPEDEDTLDDGPAEVYADEEVTPDMMLSDADRALPSEGIPDGDRPMQEDDLLAEEDGPAEVYADEDVTLEMMLSDADRALPGDGIAANDKAMPEDDLPDEDGPGEAYADEDVTPEMMLSDADRSLPPDQMAAVARAAPAPTPAPAAVVPRDDSTPDFPVTKYNVEKAAAPVVTKADAPKAAPKAPTELPVTIKSDGLFGFDRTNLRNELVIKLDAVADMLNGARYDKIVIVGHADPIGSAKYNQGLSERRAAAVKKYLIGKGVDASRIQTAGKGESELVVKYKDCAGKRKKALIECFEPNRRVVIDAAGIKASK